VKRLGAICCALTVLLSAATPASGYYHFLHFRQTESGLVGVPERFDRAALVDGTVYFYVSSHQRPRLQANDSFDGLVSQVRQALATWDAVPTSSLRVGFGGVLDGPLEGSTPCATRPAPTGCSRRLALSSTAKSGQATPSGFFAPVWMRFTRLCSLPWSSSKERWA
jgi:hypothetical protein